MTRIPIERRAGGGMRVTLLAALLAAATAIAPALPVGAAQAGPLELVIANGRVMDPETGLDAIRHVGIAGGQIVAVSEEPLQGSTTVDATGMVVAPGFIDLHAHGQDPVSARLQAQDGVTTALEMEAGVFPVDAWLASRAGESPIHYGATASHIGARLHAFTDTDAVFTVTMSDEEQRRAGILGHPSAWQEASAERVDTIAEMLSRGLDAGGLGIGFGVTYTPGASRTEIYRLFRLAAARGVTAFIHLRGEGSGGTLGAFQEAIALAASTGASVHIVHLNSSADELAPVALEMIRGAQQQGLDVTTEAYPYTAGSTRIESALFDSWEDLADEAYGRLEWPATGERLNAETFRAYRQEGGWVIIHGRDEQTNEWIVAQPDVMVASDGIPFLHGPAHPRGAGTFARVLGRYVRERGVLTLMQALHKMTLAPALRLQDVAPAMARKGRLQPGADADITVFDPEAVIDRASYSDGDAPSAGIVHVLVAGTFVVRDGELVEGATPGRAIVSAAAGS